MTVPYSPTTWVNGTTPLSQTHLNNLETQSAVALNSFNPDMFSAFVYYGFTAAKDVSTPNQLDVALGVAYLIQSDGTLGRISLTSSTQVTSTPSTTYHLYLQPAGTWYWNTGNSFAANSLHIANVTTDGSGNILTVTDLRPKLPTFLPNIMGTSSANVDFKGGIVFGGTTQWNAAAIFSIDSLGSGLGFNAGAPTIISTATAVSGSGLGAGVYKYVCTVVTANGESAASGSTSVTTSGGNLKVNLSGIPLGIYSGMGERNIYRTVVNGSTYFLLTTIADNSTTTYSDTTADGSLGAQLATHPTMGGFVWKSGATVQDAIYGDGAVLFDSGKIVSDGSGDVAMGELQLNVISTNPASASQACILAFSGNSCVNYHSVQTGSAQGHIFATWTGSALAAPLSIGGGNNVIPGGALSGFDANGNYIGGGYVASGQSGTAPATASSGTIAVGNLGVTRTAPTGNISSVILAAGSVAGQQVTVVNEANFTVTFAASGTSHVADGASDTIPALTARTFTWDGGTSLWYRSA